MENALSSLMQLNGDVNLFADDCLENVWNFLFFKIFIRFLCSSSEYNVWGSVAKYCYAPSWWSFMKSPAHISFTQLSSCDCSCGKITYTWSDCKFWNNMWETCSILFIRLRSETAHVNKKKIKKKKTITWHHVNNPGFDHVKIIPHALKVSLKINK